MLVSGDVVTGGDVVDAVEVGLVDVVVVGVSSSFASPPGQPAAVRTRVPATTIRHEALTTFASRPGPGMVLVTVMPITPKRVSRHFPSSSSGYTRRASEW